VDSLLEDIDADVAHARSIMNACFAGHKELFPEAAVNKGSSTINGDVDMKAKWKWAKDQCLKRGPPYECKRD
jgi:hypothetical protein